MTDQHQRHPRLTDDAVAGLPLHHGRAELLEEIMSTPVVDETVARRQQSRRTAWLVPVAAAAAVAALATIPLWHGPSESTPGATPGSKLAPAAEGSSSQPPPSGGYVILQADGWRVDYAQNSGETGEVSYRKGEANLEITRYPAASYAGYVRDREHIVDPPAPGAPVEVLGLAGQMWAYNPTDHTVIREVEDGTWLELRGQDLSRGDYVDLLGQLRQVDLEEFEGSLPDRFVVSGERADAITEIRDGIAGALGPARGLTPMGTTEPLLESSEPDRYQLGAYVSGAVACAWFDQYSQARADGDRAARTDAAEALATTRDWPILQEMDAEGDYPEVVWELADLAVAGKGVGNYQAALGCE